MTQETKRHSGGCPVAHGLDVFGDRWTLLVLRDLMLHDKQTYGAFLEGQEGIATNILAQRLKHLEQEGVLQKRRDPENRRRYLYSLTDRGMDLIPIVLEIIRWSGSYFEMTPRRRKLVDRIEADRDAVAVEIRDRMLRLREDAPATG